MRRAGLPVLLLLLAPALPARPVPSEPFAGGVILAEAGEELRFFCAPPAPCARLRFVAPPGGGHGFDLSLVAGLHGGLDVRAHGLHDVAPAHDAMLDGGGWSLGGVGFARDEPEAFGRDLPSGTADEWRFTFFPRSGEPGGEVRIVLRWRT